MQYRRLGNSDLDVSVLSFGAWQIGDPEYWGDDPAHNPEAVVQTALDGGINLFDTAEGYGDGESERILGQILGARRKEVYVASKVFPQHCAPDALRKSCEASLARLGTDYLDLYQIHWPSHEVPFEDTYTEMLKLKEEGKIRNIGVSNFGPLDLADWLKTGDTVSNQIGYNLVFRAPEYQILPACRRNKVGVLVYSPLMQGVLAGCWKNPDDIPLLRRRFRHYSNSRAGTRHGEAGHEAILTDVLSTLEFLAQGMEVSMASMCLAWLIAQRGVTSAIVGSRNPQQLKDNLAAADLKIGAEEMYAMNAITGQLKMAMGLNADLWEGTNSSRIQ